MSSLISEARLRALAVERFRGDGGEVFIKINLDLSPDDDGRKVMAQMMLTVTGPDDIPDVEPIARLRVAYLADLTELVTDDNQSQIVAGLWPYLRAHAIDLASKVGFERLEIPFFPEFSESK